MFITRALENDRNSFSFSAPKMTRFDGFSHFRFRTKLYFAFLFLVSFLAKITDENPKIINLRSGSVSVQSGQTYNQNETLRPETRPRLSIFCSRRDQD